MTKRKKIIIAVTVSAATVIVAAIVTLSILYSRFFSGPNIDNPFQGDGTQHTVMFDSCGGSEVESSVVRDGNPVRTPSSPTLENYIFVGWYTAADGGELWDFHTDRVKADITLYAHWAEAETVVYTDSLTYELNAQKNGYTVTGSGQESVIIIPAEYEGLPVTAIGESAFAYSRHNADILSITLPNSITAIERNAFYNQSELGSVIIGENSELASIGNNAFSGCGALKNIYIPRGVTVVGDSAFNNCGAIDFEVFAGNPAYRSENGHLIERSTNTLIRGGQSGVVPDGITAIAQAAFRKNTAIMELVIPASVVSIGNYMIADSGVAAVRYIGTVEQWESIAKARLWNSGKKDVEILYAQ